MDSPWAMYARRERPAGRAFAALLPATCCLLAALGCSNGRQLQTDLYQRELRLQEDEIYRLEDYIEEYQAIIRGYRCEVAELRRDLAEAHEAVPAEKVAPIDSGDVTPLDDPSNLIDDPIEMIPPPVDESGPAFEATPVESGEESGVAPDFEPAPLFESSSATPIESAIADAPKPDAASGTVASALHEEPESPPAAYPQTQPVTEAVHTAARAIRVSVSPAGSEAAPYDALTVYVSEREHAALAGFSGTVSVMLTDPEAEGRRRRIALWDFTARETAEAWNIDRNGNPRLELSIEAPNETPRDRELRVWVRLIDSAGQKRLESTTVRFGGPGRGLASGSVNHPRRLPSTGGIGQVTETAGVAGDVQADGEWRSARPRRVFDSAVRPAAYEAR